MEVARRYFISLGSLQPARQVCADPRRPPQHGSSMVTTLSRGDPLCGFPRSALGCGICLSHPYRTSLPRMVLNFHFYAHSDPVPDGHFRAMSGDAAGPVFYTTFPAPGMARKRTLGKLTIEPVDVGGLKLTKPWVHLSLIHI